MLSRVLIASDGSEATDHMMDCAKDLVSVGARQATLVHVFHVRDVGGLHEQLRQVMLPRLEAQRKIPEAAGLQAKVETPVGIPFVVINRLVLEQRADLILDRAGANDFTLILMGSNGRGAVKELFLGGVANNVARHAPLPVLFIPGVR